MELAQESKVNEFPDSRAADRPKLAGLTLISVALLSLLLAIFIRTHVLESVEVQSESMLPALLPGDLVLVSKLSYGLNPWEERLPQRGDVVLVSGRDDTAVKMVKRVVGLPGDQVEIRGFSAFVNGELVDRRDKIVTSSDLQLIAERKGNSDTKMIAQGEYFVLGDNRPNSEDSRFYGPISAEQIVGRATFIYWSHDIEREGSPIRWSRVWKWVD